MTKLLTCTCALQLFEQGKYAMDDPVWKYLPEYKTMEIAGGGYAKNAITIRHLFSMAAGLNYNQMAPGIQETVAQGKTSTRQIAAALGKSVLDFEPGTRMQYSYCHDVLGALIEVWSGERLSQYMQKNLFEPLEMKNSFFGIPKDAERLGRLAQRYDFGADRQYILLPLTSPHHLWEGYESGGAGVTSCTEDYALFLDALANGGVGKNGNRILQISTVELMRTNQMKGMQLDDFDALRKGYGYGFGCRTHMDPARSGSLSPTGEFGWDGAGGCFSMVDPQNKLSLTYFQQIHKWDMGLQARLRNALYSSLEL